MMIAEVAVGFHCQSAAVLVAEPSADGGDINARFNATSSKQVAKIVVGDALDFQFPARSGYRSLALLDSHHGLIGLNILPFRF